MNLTKGAIEFMASQGICSLQIPEIVTNKETEEVPDSWVERVLFYPYGRQCLSGEPGVLCLSEIGFAACEHRLRSALEKRPGHGFTWNYFVLKARRHFSQSKIHLGIYGDLLQKKLNQIREIQDAHNFLSSV